VHEPETHASPTVQNRPSSQVAVLFPWTHPVPGLHESSVQALPSSQLGAAPPTHVPLSQASLVVHAFPSVQVLPSSFV
jgi:hypothetical protein